MAFVSRGQRSCGSDAAAQRSPPSRRAAANNSAPVIKNPVDSGAGCGAADACMPAMDGDRLLQICAPQPATARPPAKRATAGGDAPLPPAGSPEHGGARQIHLRGRGGQGQTGVSGKQKRPVPPRLRRQGGLGRAALQGSRTAFPHPLQPTRGSGSGRGYISHDPACSLLRSDISGWLGARRTVFPASVNTSPCSLTREVLS